MQIKKVLSVFLFVQLLFNCQENAIQKGEVKIIPMPSKQTLNEGQFILSSSTGIDYPEALKVSAEFLKSFIEQSKRIRLNKGNDIQFIIDTSIENDEGYSLQILPNSIEVKAKTDQGAFYAVQTLRQLLSPDFENGSFNAEQVYIPCVSITDAPQFIYRGMHLDVGRHLFSVDFIKKYVDALAMLKMNTFHWHLTEDQGWRIEIKKYPKLQEVAAYRNETLIGHYNAQPQLFDGKKYGGYYTQEQIKEIVAYASARFITVIPEIELPGHSQAAIAAYPELGCTGEQVEVAKKGGVFENIYCPKEETFAFLEAVFDEVLELFPSKYIHIGGDEAPKTNWKKCKSCQQRIKDEGLKDEHELQSYFISRIEEYLNSKGRQIIGWDEILEGGLAPNATVMSWRGFDGAIEAAKQHHNVILTPGSHCYFDHYQSENKDEPLAIGGFLPLEKVYSLNPIPDELTEEEAKYVLGAQGNVWTEYMPNTKQVEYMVFPRILALSEVVWLNSKERNYKEFASRVENFHKRLDALDINYANHLFEIEGELLSIENNIVYQMETSSKGKIIRYTLEGSEPTADSEVYKEPVSINESVNLKARVFDAEEKLGTTFSQEINLHKAVGATITINKELNKSYPGSGAAGLVNGISGSNYRYGDKEWLGFSGEDIEIVIDLKQVKHIHSIETRFHNGQGQWIYAPKEIEIALGNGSFEVFELNANEDLIIDFKSIFEGEKAKEIRLRIPNYGIIPDGKQGAGNKAWTFIDEIIIN
ncbi:beta-N-acetylhexosaminidase [Winogradskyella sp. UBA3174]|mgnify:CR=1 FL=1|uniref:beta-N-acetylhexosaminidase n=1 Tax=Winogradskyella sp. UBA3174 TaxID=1947785 RepID=UPI0025D4D59C|nr:family 20 glycosylhydrolase [Winogradskyella sp. UBA3174]|tara:strand:- start:25582 stop:27855 length:2274 start_codon:yes stop_codon:yes gene_type:complete